MSPLLVLGCSVCYGDPASPLTIGAKAGVLVLAAFIVAVLFAFIGVILFWARRARQIDAGLLPADGIAVTSPAQS